MLNALTNVRFGSKADIDQPLLTNFMSTRPSKFGSLAMLLAMRRASSSVSALAMWASFAFSHE
jgi:hypothetical protein